MSISKSISKIPRSPAGLVPNMLNLISAGPNYLLVGPKARAERSQCVEKAKHIGDRRLLAHTVGGPCPTIIGGEESSKTSSSAGPWCWPRPRHRGQ